jgi:hypothetical protein
MEINRRRLTVAIHGFNTIKNISNFKSKKKVFPGYFLLV